MTNRSYRRPAEIFGPKIAPEAVRCFDLSYRLQKPRKHIDGGTQSMSAYDPKRTWDGVGLCSEPGREAEDRPVDRHVEIVERNAAALRVVDVKCLVAEHRAPCSGF